MATIKVSLDGGVTYQDAPHGVRIIFGEVPMPGDAEVMGEVHVNATHEGLITDVWANDQNLGTQSESVEDIAYGLAGDK